MKSKGFTLIELLFVIAVVALLFSIVLTLVGNTRDKAQSRSFRQEVDQFVKAIELYRADKGTVPGQPNGSFYYRTRRDQSPAEIGISPSLPIALNGYISKIPIAPFGAYFYYRFNTGARCSDGTVSPSYLIIINSTEPGFEDWPYYVGPNGITLTSYRCFSIK